MKTHELFEIIRRSDTWKVRLEVRTGVHPGEGLSKQDGQLIASRLGGRVLRPQMQSVQAWGGFGEADWVFIVEFRTRDEAIYALKRLRRMARGKPQFVITAQPHRGVFDPGSPTADVPTIFVTIEGPKE